MASDTSSVQVLSEMGETLKEADLCPQAALIVNVVDGDAEPDSPP